MVIVEHARTRVGTSIALLKLGETAHLDSRGIPSLHTVPGSRFTAIFLPAISLQATEGMPGAPIQTQVVLPRLLAVPLKACTPRTPPA